MTRGIYRFVNKRTRREYIGKSKNIEYRAIAHRRDMEEGKHHNYKVQRDFNEYPDIDKDWHFEMVCVVPKPIPLSWVENYYIRLLTERDYNLKRPKYTKWEIPLEVVYWVIKQFRLIRR